MLLVHLWQQKKHRAHRDSNEPYRVPYTAHTANQEASVNDQILGKCLFSSHKYETPLETKPPFSTILYFQLTRDTDKAPQTLLLKTWAHDRSRCAVKIRERKKNDPP